MNAFEAYNLRKLSENLEAAKLVKEARKREILENEVRHMVYILFEKHKGDLSKVKSGLQEEKDILEKLNLQEVANKEYLRHKRKRDIYDPDKHRKFWDEVRKLETAHALVAGILGKHKNITDAKKELITYTEKIKHNGFADYVRNEWKRQIEARNRRN